MRVEALHALAGAADAAMGPGAAVGRRDRGVALGRVRVVRGTQLDVFGRTKVRRVERELIAEYREVIERLLARLDADNIARATAIASLPDLVRGYEEIKLQNVRKYREALREALARYEVAPS